ncbi:MAG: insulinase family protein [Gammaproteobacteria bacterium]|nr:insulinase family protein [Gammaproteobacteria bacterium]
MKKRITSGLLGCALLLSGCVTEQKIINSSAENLPQGIKKIESVSQQADEISIPYTKYRLDNGLTVVLHEDKSDPLVHVDITYHVGSGREEIGKSGFAHFFEHMMFQGSENVDDEQHFALITESGGTLNGTTNSDRTNYFETVPSNQLERMLWLEADRMGFFLDAVTQAKFENQRETVKNERAQRYENRPYGLLWERVGEAMYPEGHPYSWSTIGYIEDLNRADLSDLKQFFLRWYGPNNATLTIGGEIDKDQTLAWVKKYFSGIPRGPEVTAPVYEAVELDADRYISMEDNVSLPLMYMSFPTVRAFHPDEAPLDVLMDILGTGKTSLLYKNLVKSGKAVQAQAGHGCRELSCQFTLLSLPTPGNTLAELESITRESFREFEERGVMDDDLARVKSQIISGMIYGLESVSGKVSQLASYETFYNNPNTISADIARYENVTKADVIRVYETYIKGKPSVVMSIVPKGQINQIIKPDTWQRYQRQIPESSQTEELELRVGTSDFDRSIIPAPGPNPVILVPDYYQFKTQNEIEVIGAINSEVPTTALSIRIEAGQSREPLDKLGIASLTASMLGEATLKSSAEDMANELKKLGSSVSFSTSNQYTTINIRSLSDNLDQTLDIAMEKLTQPKFDVEDFERLKQQQIEGLKFEQKEARVTANNVFSGLLYGKQNAFAYANSGTINTVLSLTLEDVKGFYRDNFGPSGAQIAIVSSLGKNDVSNLLKRVDSWSGGNTPAPELTAFPDLEGGTLYLIDKPGAAQSEIRIGKRALNYDATGEYYKAGLMNYNLGDAFNSRINLNLREDKGYTYGARSRFSGTKYSGQFSAYAGVRADATAASIVEFRKEIDGVFNGGITADELNFMQSALGQRDARAYETPNQKLGFLSEISEFDLDHKFVDEQNKILTDISTEELSELASKHLDLSEMITVVVGDKSVILEGLSELSDRIVELDVNGEVVE